jgi:hypothetical protein
MNKFQKMKKYQLFFICIIASLQTFAQYAFELKVEYSTRIQNLDQFALSGTILKGRIENGKDYFLDDGTKIVINNIISAKSATSVPVASAPESVSMGISCKNHRPEHGDILKCVSAKPLYGGNVVSYNPNKTPEGELMCKLNGRLYRAKTISKPVLIKAANMLDLFFEADDKSVIWLQLNNFTDIETTPHTTKSDTSIHDRVLVCKVAYLPSGYRPTDMPNNYRAYEDVKGNAGITVTYLNKYEKKISLEFSGILRANEKMIEEKPNAGGLFYINDGHVDNISWDAF